MHLKLYNTLTRVKEVFVPLDPAHVRFYVCGPTVYGPIHIGNARPVVVFDLLFRLLQRLYSNVTYVQNITDVDDKIIKAANASKETITSLTERMTALFQENVQALHSLPPTLQPRATDHIPHMIQMIETLISKGHAYLKDGHVLFDTTSFKDYGSLSNKALDDLVAGARVDVSDYKKNAGDFVLWKPSEVATIGWDSPWGYGRPGWHIECSAMSAEHLGPVFDIHGGGIDLIFPHHENEQAQSRCALGEETMARYWMHNGHLMVEGQKMSKSLGNFLTVQDLLEETPGEVIRLTLLASHYRQPLDWQADMVHQAKKSLGRFYGALKNYPYPNEPSAEMPDAFLNALLDDLNTPQALAVMHELATEIHKTDDATAKPAKQAMLLAAGQLLGLFNVTAQDWFQSGDNLHCSEPEILAAIDARNQARAEKDFAKADFIRQDLETKGIALEDTSEGTSWRRL